MALNNLYNFKNTIRHFINIDNLSYPSDISSFDTSDLCWTAPIPYRIKKDGDKYRTIKMPNILNFARAYNYYCGLPNFNDINNMDSQHKRLSANIDTGDFVSGQFNEQLNEDFTKLCTYDCLLKLDISEYYGKIYTHYLDLDNYNLMDNVLSSLYNGRTSGVLMGNYLCFICFIDIRSWEIIRIIYNPNVSISIWITSSSAYRFFQKTECIIPFPINIKMNLLEVQVKLLVMQQSFFSFRLIHH